uniref:Uncharacterized protein n=1 Tax=Anopheles dirus TaxID=7168 RepID=A0A182NXA7_9DIPT
VVFIIADTLLNKTSLILTYLSPPAQVPGQRSGRTARKQPRVRRTHRGVRSHVRALAGKGPLQPRERSRPAGWLRISLAPRDHRIHRGMPHGRRLLGPCTKRTGSASSCARTHHDRVRVHDPRGRILCARVLRDRIREPHVRNPCARDHLHARSPCAHVHHDHIRELRGLHVHSPCARVRHGRNPCVRVRHVHTREIHDRHAPSSHDAHSRGLHDGHHGHRTIAQTPPHCPRHCSRRPGPGRKPSASRHRLLRVQYMQLIAWSEN